MKKYLRLTILLLVTSVYWACSSATVPCVASDEVCNGIDDDCDGATDEDPVDVDGQACGSDEGECSPGVEVCEDGHVVCQGAVGPSDEVCNNKDDDCDGDTDEDLSGCACTGGGQPSAELCNNLDDDCDGAIDEDLQGCACTDGGQASAEVCNQVDDDCNGQVDDGLSDCACSDGGQPTSETCNMIDDDCDGLVDEDNGSGGGCLGLGEACTAYTQCSSQICIGDIFSRYCSQQCQASDPAPCPAGYECFVGSNMDYCRKVWPACDSDTDCSPDMVCTVQDMPDGLSVQTECRPPLDPGAEPGDDCSQANCANDLCMTAGFCSEVCSETSPCAGQYQGMDTTCILTAFYTLPGVCGRDEQCPADYTCTNSRCTGPSCNDSSECETGYACTDSVCSPAWQVDRVGTCQIACSGDSDCVDPLVCQLGITEDGSAIQGKCSAAYNGNPTGGSCVPDGCDHGLCITSQDYCTQLCGDANDCPGGWNCTLLNWNVGSLGTFPAYACTMP